MRNLKVIFILIIPFTFSCDIDSKDDNSITGNYLLEKFWSVSNIEIDSPRGWIDDSVRTWTTIDIQSTMHILSSDFDGGSRTYTFLSN